MAAAGAADLGEVGGLVADEKDGGGRVGGLGLDVAGHAGGEHIDGAAMAPGERGPFLHRSSVSLGSMPQCESGQIPLQCGEGGRSLGSREGIRWVSLWKPRMCGHRTRSQK